MCECYNIAIPSSYNLQFSRERYLTRIASLESPLLITIRRCTNSPEFVLFHQRETDWGEGFCRGAIRAHLQQCAMPWVSDNGTHHNLTQISIRLYLLQHEARRIVILRISPTWVNGPQLHVCRIDRVCEIEGQESVVIRGEGALRALVSVPRACGHQGGIVEVVRDNLAVGEWLLRRGPKAPN